MDELWQRISVPFLIANFQMKLGYLNVCYSVVISGYGAKSVLWPLIWRLVCFIDITFRYSYHLRSSSASNMFCRDFLKVESKIRSLALKVRRTSSLRAAGIKTVITCENICTQAFHKILGSDQSVSNVNLTSLFLAWIVSLCTLNWPSFRHNEQDLHFVTCFKPPYFLHNHRVCQLLRLAWR